MLYYSLIWLMTKQKNKKLPRSNNIICCLDRIRYIWHWTKFLGSIDDRTRTYYNIAGRILLVQCIHHIHTHSQPNKNSLTDEVNHTEHICAVVIHRMSIGRTTNSHLYCVLLNGNLSELIYVQKILPVKPMTIAFCPPKNILTSALWNRE